MKYKFNQNYIDCISNFKFKKGDILDTKLQREILKVFYKDSWIFDAYSRTAKLYGELINENNNLDSSYIQIQVWLENDKLDYDTVKNHWLCDFKTEDKNIDEGEFYIYINTLENLFNIITETGEDIQITMLCDEPIIKII